MGLLACNQKTSRDDDDDDDDDASKHAVDMGNDVVVTPKDSSQQRLCEGSRHSENKQLSGHYLVCN
jgi:hypothetical protein